jgi:hypothetical protein
VIQELVAEIDYTPFVKGLLDGVDMFLRQRLAQIDAGDLGAGPAGLRQYFDSIQDCTHFGSLQVR